jgi:hypothetical protein
MLETPAVAQQVYKMFQGRIFLPYLFTITASTDVNEEIK